MATLANQGMASQMAFGQHGCAFIDDGDHVLVPPDGMVVVAIQCLGDTEFDTLIAEDPTQFINTASAAHGIASQAVGGGGGSAGSFNSEYLSMAATATASLGDSVYSDAGAFLARIVEKGTLVVSDGSTLSTDTAIKLDRSVSIANSATLLFANKGQGGGGHTLATANVFPKGMTIYGRWAAVSLAADQNSDGAVCYFGPTYSPV